MNGLSAACAFWCVVVCLLVSGCERSGPGKDQDTHIQPGAQPRESDAWGYLALKVVRVHERQQPLEQTPWHADGGDWTFLECQLDKLPDIRVMIGARTKSDAKGEVPIGWGEAVLTVADTTAGARFVEAFAKAFHCEVPAAHGQKPRGRVKVNTAVLGTNLARDRQGGFKSRSGSWTATKWFFEDETGEAEVFFNYSVTEKRAEFSEKDEEYREALVQQLVIGLRDGPLPERTPENDPSLTLVGPKVTGWTRVADPNTTCHFTPDSRTIVFTETGTNGRSRLSWSSLALPGERKPLAEFEGSAGVREFLTNEAGLKVFVVETVRRDQKTISSADPQRLWLVTAAEKRPVPVPARLTNWFVAERCVSPDGRFVALHTSRTQPNKKRSRVVHLGELRADNWRTFEMPDTILELVGWMGTNGVVVTGTGYEKGEVRRAYRLDPATGQLVSMDSFPDELNPSRKLSPDRRRVAEVREKQRLIITDLASQQTREFTFHPYDLRNVYPDSVAWGSERYLIFQGARTALIDVQTLRMSFPTAKDSGFAALEFSPDFKTALGRKEDGRYLGHVVPPEGVTTGR